MYKVCPSCCRNWHGHHGGGVGSRYCCRLTRTILTLEGVVEGKVRHLDFYDQSPMYHK
jgi:hypothetical protein